MKRHGWARISPPGPTCWGHWLHESSGWHVEHCGHPTANWPYYAFHGDQRLLADNGRGFRTLKDAMIGVEAFLEKNR